MFFILQCRKAYILLIFSNYMELVQEGLNLVYGGEATGKTTLALMKTAKVLKNKGKVVFLDTEDSFSLERFKQIYGEGAEEAITNLFIIHVKDFEDQKEKVRNIEKLNKIDLIIIDSLGNHYRKALAEDSKEANKEIHQEMNIFKALNYKGSKILITNQVYTHFDYGIEMVGAKMIRKWANLLIQLEKDKEARYYKMLKPQEQQFQFEIDDKGINLVTG